MIDSLKGIIKNTTILYAVELINKILQFVFIVYAARALGVESFGDLSYVLTLYTLIQMFSDYGLSISLPREVAQSPEGKDRTFRIAFHLRGVVTAITIALFAVYLYIVNDPNLIKASVVVGGLGLLLSIYAQNYVLALRGLGLMKMDGAIRVASTFITTVFSVAAIMAGKGVVGVAVALFLGNLFMVGLSVAINRKYRIISVPSGTLSRKDYLSEAKEGLPLMFMIVIAVFYNRVDTLLLQHLKGAVEVGLYHAGMRVTEGLLIFQTAFAMVLLPALSRHIGEKDAEAVRKITQLSIKYMAIIGMFLTTVTVMTADKIIDILYLSSDYNGATLGLQLFSFVNLMFYLTTPIGYLLLASGREHVAATFNLIMLVINISINLLVIPRYGFAGAAVVRFGTEVLGLVMSLFVIRKYMFKIRFFSELFKPFLAGSLTAIFIYFSKSLLFIPVYMIFYGIVLYLMKSVTRWEVDFVKEIFMQKLKKS